MSAQAQNDTLVVGDDAGTLGERSEEIQARFVDDPREAVHDADALATTSSTA